ncbi:hypothetical protein [Streptomyces eurythermus]
MPRLVRTVVYVVLLFLGLSLSPAKLYHQSLITASIGLLAVLLVQIRTTRNTIDYALAWVALWAMATVLVTPFVPAFRALGELVGGVL